MKKLAVIYDDRIESNDRIKTIIGNNSFGNVVIKRKKLFQYIEEIVGETPDILFEKITKDSNITFADTDDYVYFYIKSTSAVIDVKEFKIILEKLRYINETTKVMTNEKMSGIAFCNFELLKDFLKNMTVSSKTNQINTACFSDISSYDNLLMYISSAFDSRYFNSISGDKYYVEKKSKDKKKMKMEYSYYWLIPEEMKSFMVLPYDYKEEKDYASYKMERMPMTDIAIRFTHHAVDLDEFKKILDKTFHFFNSRTKKEITKEKYIEMAKSLYITKTEERLKKLKSTEEYETLNLYIKNGTKFNDIEEIYQEYETIYEKMMTKYLKKEKKFYQVIGHGDVFFANMLYSKEINLLRLIDPKGALTEEDLYMNPYYDIAKLSHSICGRYDFFNTDMYDITINKDMKLELNIDFDNTPYIMVFKQYLDDNGYNYSLTRLFEASLFLSMLPLHIDNPRKVLGFILNAITILQEVKKYV